MKTTQFGINMGQCSRQAYFKFHLHKQSSHITIFSLCFLNLTSCIVIIRSVIMCCTEACSPLVMSFITIKSLHIDLLIHIFGWYADILWAQLVHSFDQVVSRVLLCGHLTIQYIINTLQIGKFLPRTIRCPMRFIECLPKDAPILSYLRIRQPSCTLYLFIYFYFYLFFFFIRALTMSQRCFEFLLVSLASRKVFVCLS